MISSQRRDKIMDILINQSAPLSAGAIAQMFSVSRQVIVGDIALLRASGANICATPRGYIFENIDHNSSHLEKTIACQHNNEDLSTEIYTIIDNGGVLIDVTVEHPLYGQLSGPLHIYSRYDADVFMDKLAVFGCKPLSDLTDGIHLHRIRCTDEKTYYRIIDLLTEKGILLQLD